MVSYEIAQAGPEGLHDKYVNSKLIYEPFSPLHSLVSAFISKRKVSIAMRMHERFKIVNGFLHLPVGEKVQFIKESETSPVRKETMLIVRIACTTNN